MKKIGFFLLLLFGATMSLLSILLLPEPFDLWLGILIGGFTIALLFLPHSKKNVRISIAGFKWTINDFCRGWLITGQTGSGKTACAIRNILHALFTDVPDWGGAVVDQKGQFYEIVAGIAGHYQLSDKLVILRVGPEESPARYNILSYPGISWSSYAALIIDTAESMGIKLEPFWKSKAEVLLRGILQMIGGYRTPTLGHLVRYTNNQNDLEQLVDKVLKEPELAGDEAVRGAQEIKGQILDLGAEETKSSIMATTQSMVAYFNDPKIQEVLCPEENTVDFRDVDKGKIFVLSMAQSYDRQRIYFNTFLKLLFMTHAKYRFDDPGSIRKKNLLVFLADEAQQIVTSSAYASDHEAVSVIREARATYILATQSTTSLAARLKKEDMNTLILNLASKFYFTVADQEAAEVASKDLGLIKTKEVSKSVSKGVESISTRDIEKPLYSPAELRKLKKFQCVLKHPNGTTEKMFLPPLDDEKRIPAYYYKERFSFLWWFFWKIQF